ncbi:hypothetical protein [Mangrovibacterium sp.]|uniref:hypothetical protein n=1 Tax=Mangrovibacterium sp. TaxID=1961364 RepID=UPI003563E53B
MLSTEKKLEITERIIASDTLKNAPTSIAILRYLVQANLEERSLKEGIIDIEFFGAKPEDENNNPRVRVNIYNLRKKLASYYEQEGANDPWQIKIEKGQYGVTFEKTEFKLRKFPKSDRKQVLPWMLAFLALSITVVNHFPHRKPLIWKNFFNNKQQTYLFVGDAFGYGGHTVSGLNGWTRDFSINSLDEYYEMLEKKPELKSITVPTDYNYSTRMAENATHDLARFFTRWDNDFEIKYATQSTFSDIKKGNIIYIGRFKDQKDFTYLFNEANTKFKILDNQIHFLGNEQLPAETFAMSQNDTELDYALVSRVPGPNNTEQFFFFSNHDIGVMATVEFFTNQDSLRAFTQKHLDGNSSFTALFKSKGKERVNLSLEEILVVPFNH